MKALLNVYKDDQRTIWLADSFQGLPKPNSEKYPDDANDTLWSHSLDVSLEEVKSNFAKYDLFDENRLRFLVGFFSETMPIAPIEKISLLRLDGDMYESTIEVLDNLYHKVSTGGYIIVDDYGCIPACKSATDDFRSQNKITEPLKKIDWTGVFWKKEV